MRSTNRYCCCVLVLILLIGHSALSLHVTTHILADLANCDICIGQVNPANAIPPSTGDLRPPVAAYKIESDYFASVSTTAEFTPYHQRAPPALA